MLFGAAYYPEYQPYDRLEADIALMRQAGMNLVRLGESAWASWEPDDGRFELDRMHRVLEQVHAAGIRAVLGTPTYAIPPWLARKYPEIMARRADGTPIPYGGRQNADFTHPAYRYHAARVIRAIVGRFAAHPAVIGYQVDNETGIELLHNDGVFAAFVDYLRRRYGDVEELNNVWGLTYWSQRLSRWADLWRPAGNTCPGYDLDWRRFQASLTTEFLGWQAAIVREYARPGQFVTHCLVGGHGRPAADRFAIAQLLDLPAENIYVAAQDGLSLPEPDNAARYAPSWCEPGGARRLSLMADMGRSGNQRRFLVTETNAQAIGLSHENFPAYDGQWRLMVYALLARGAEGVSYWHWHTCHQGNEQYWAGVLGHDLEPGRAYQELARTGRELSEHASVLDGLRPDADVALLYSQDSKYALSFQPPLADPQTGAPDRQSYEQIFDAFYRAFFDTGAQLAILHPDQAWEAYPVLVAPALYIADEALCERLAHYARDGGHLVLSFRSGYADEFARARWTRAPGPLRDAVGASYQEFSTLPDPLGVTGYGDGLALPPAARATAWADGLQLEGASALAGYDHPHFGRFPAATTRRHGAGRVTYIGTLPGPSFGAALARWVTDSTRMQPAWPGLPSSVRATTATTADGGARLYFLSNWSAQPASTRSPISGHDLLSGDRYEAGDPVPLPAWDLRILRVPADDPAR